MRSVLLPYSFTKSKRNRLLSWLGVYPKIFSEDFHGHATLSDLKKAMPPNLFDDYFKFSFVRNPWDWQVSLYQFARQRRGHPQHNLTLKMSFEEYIEWRVQEDLELQKRFIVDDDDEILADFVGKFENLATDFEYVLDFLKIPSKNLPKLNTTKRGDYRNYYNDRTRRIVEEAFKRDIELFGYEF